LRRADACRRLAPTARLRGAWEGPPIAFTESHAMFFFFSNKLGWVGSILVSIVLTLLLIGLFALF
jgi:hypothetical protein